VPLSLRYIAGVLNGDVYGDGVRAPGPNHSHSDRSLSIKLTDDGTDVVVNSFSPKDDRLACLAYVRQKLGIQPKPKVERFSETDIERAVMMAAEARKPKANIVAVYPYEDRDGTLLYENVRFDPKDFRARRPDGSGGYIWKLGDVRRVPYRWPQLLQHPDATVFICEGEKDSDSIASLDLCATTAASGKWTAEVAVALEGRDCWIIQDCDEAGKNKAIAIAHGLHGVANSVKIVALPGLDGTKGNKDVTDWLDQGHTKDELIAACADTPDWQPGDASVVAAAPTAPTAAALPVPRPQRQTGKALILQRLFPMIKVTDLAADNVEDEYLIDELLPRTGLAVIWGPPKSGKSFWTIDVAMHVALGWQYRDRFVEQGTVVYLALEGQRGMRKRVLAFLRHHFTDKAVPVIPFHLILVPVKVTTHAKTLVEEIRFELGDDVPKLIVIDTLARAIVGDETGAKDMGAFIQAADNIRLAFNCCILVVHHSGWSGDHSRGSSALPAALDVELSCSCAGQGLPVVVKTERAKDMADDGEIVSMLQKVDTGKFNRTGMPITSMVVVAADPGIVTRKRRFSPDVELAYDALIDAINECGELVSHKRIPATSRTIRLSEWMSGFEQKDTKGDANPDSRRTAFRRAVRKLEMEKTIGFWKPYVWLLKEPGQNGQSGQL
jgi:AAA domain-containing protein